MNKPAVQTSALLKAFNDDASQRWAAGASKDLSQAEAVSQEIRAQRESEQHLALFVLLRFSAFNASDSSARQNCTFVYFDLQVHFVQAVYVNVYVAFQCFSTDCTFDQCTAVK